MSQRNVLLVALASVLVVVGIFFLPEPARADFGAAGRLGGGFGHAGIAGRLSSGGAGIGGSFRLGGDMYGRSGAHGRRGHARPGAMLGNRFLAYQRSRLTGRRLPAFVQMGDAQLIAQRQRLNAKYLGPDRLRRFHHRKLRGRCCGQDAFYPWPLGVPGGGVPPIIIVQVKSPAPPAPAAQPPQPLDPRGRIKAVAEDEQATDDWSPGDVLPDELPQVTLDHASYGLPIPPPGEKYARIGNDVLRIDAGTRRITEVVAR